MHLPLSDRMILKNENKHQVPPKLYKYKAIDENNRTLDLLKTDFMYIANATQFNDNFEGQLVHDSDKALKIITFKVLYGALKESISDDDYNKIVNSENPSIELKKWVYNDPSNDSDLSFEEFSEKLDESIKPVVDGVYTFFNNYIKEKTLIASFSDKYDNKGMWGIYANDNSGICIEYNFYDLDDYYLLNNFFKPSYLDENDYPDSTDALFQIPDIDYEYFFKEPFLRKTLDWSNESEWRIILPNDPNLRDIIKEIGSKFFIKLPKPRAIYLGTQISPRNKNNILKICKIREISVFELQTSNLDYVKNEILSFPQGRPYESEYIKECITTKHFNSLIYDYFICNNISHQRELIEHALINTFKEIDDEVIISEFLNVILFKNKLLAVSSYYYFNILYLLIMLNKDDYFNDLRTSDGKNIKENLLDWMHMCITKFSDVKVLQYLSSFEKLLNCFYARYILLDEDFREKFEYELDYGIDLKYVPNLIVDVKIGKIIHPIYDQDYTELFERNIINNLIQIFDRFYYNGDFNECGCKKELNRIYNIVTKICEYTSDDFDKKYFERVDYHQDSMLRLSDKDSFRVSICNLLNDYEECFELLSVDDEKLLKKIWEMKFEDLTLKNNLQ